MNKLNKIMMFFAVACINQLSAQQSVTKMIFSLTASASVSDIADDGWNASILSLEVRDYMGNPDKLFLMQQKQKVASLYPIKKSTQPNKSGTIPTPLINTGFDGNQFNNSVPLDNYLAVSDSNKIVSVSNVQFRVYSTDGTSLLNKTLAQFCQPAGLGGINNGKFDPKVMYDPLEDRFIAVVLNGFNSTYSKIIVAFSQTNDPAGVWNFYVLPGNPFNDTTWFDYPALNITENELFITGNQIRENVSWQLGFKQTVIWQIRKKEGYAGLPLVTNLWDGIAYNGRKIRNLHPVKGGSSIQGPGQYFLSNRNFDIQNDTLFIVHINDTIDAPGLALTIDMTHTDKAYGVPPHGRQKGINRYAATNDGRILAAFYENGKIQFASNCIDTSNGRSGIFFGIISGVDNQSYSVTSTIISVDTLDFGYPNLSWVGEGTLGSQSILSFEHTGENRFPGISTLFYADGEFSDIIPVKEGVGNLIVLSDTIERWGDYFGSQPVYNRNGKIWIAGTYGNASNRHQTWIAQLDNPYGAETSIPTVTPKLSMNLFPNPSFEMVYLNVDLPASGNVRVELLDLKGKLIDQIFYGKSKIGKNQFTFNAASLASGTYIVRFTVEGHSPVNTKFIKQ
jgi:hypothetical protein